MPASDRIHSLLTPENCTVIFIDHQPQMTFGVASIDRQLVFNNVIGLAKAARIFKVPVILTDGGDEGLQRLHVAGPPRALPRPGADRADQHELVGGQEMRRRGREGRPEEARGRERAYIDSFYDRLAFDPGAIGPDDRVRYAEAFSSAGAMRAGFEVFRAFDRDAEDNRAALKSGGRLRMPVLSLAGKHSVLAPGADEPMMKEVAEHATVKLIPASGHWIADQNPEAVAEALVGFLKE